jgi:hypothetical protein
MCKLSLKTREARYEYFWGPNLGAKWVRLSGSSDPPCMKTNSWSIRANRLKLVGSIWQAGLLPFFASRECHSYSHLIPFHDGIPFVADFVGSFSPVPHPLPRSCTLQIQANRPSTFCTGNYHWNLESDSSRQIHCTTSSSRSIHVTPIMSIYQNSDIHTKKFIALIKSIFNFNYEDSNIFLQCYFLQLYCLIFYIVLLYILYTIIFLSIFSNFFYAKK